MIKRTFQYLYLTLGTLTLVFSVGALLIELLFRSESLMSTFKASIPVSLDGIRFLLWYLIFKNLPKDTFFNLTSITFEVLEKIGKILIFSFVLDVMVFLYKSFIFSGPNVEWKNIAIPSHDLPVYLVVFSWFSFLMKLFVLLNGFVTPTINGLPALLLGMMFLKNKKNIS
ncbi:hypothetical protein DOE51_10180 [Bdellovibrio sp. NC01]|nr:hypothetical protein DOE51_10180 [Bdellovibrio sp. NC01]